MRHQPLLASMPAELVFFIYQFAYGLLNQLVFTINLVYFVETAQLNPLQLVLIGTALETATFLFEIPTGVVADVYSRRISVIIGIALIGCGFTFIGLFPLFAMIALGHFLRGVGYTFTSGALQAWISDEIGEERAAGAFLRGARLRQLGALLATGLSVWLASGRLNLPIVISGGSFIVLALFLLCFMPEANWRPAARAERTTFGQMTDTVRAAAVAVRARPALSGILGIGLFFGLYSEGFDRLWTAHLLERFTFPALPAGLPEISWFGLIAATAMLLSAVAISVVERLRLHRPRHLAVAQAALTAVLILSLAGFAIARQFWAALAIYWLITALRHVIDPLYTAWVNHRIDPAVRATVLSASGLADALGQISGGPVVGLIAQRWGLQIGLLASSALLAPVAPLFAAQIRASETPAALTGSPSLAE